MKLRPYQLDAYNGIFNSWETYNKTLLVVPTGGGKSCIAAAVAKRRQEDGKVLIMAHREELLEQLADKLHKFDLPSKLEKAEHKASKDDPFVVGSVQTLLSRTEKWSKHFSTIIIDEAHHSVANSYQKVLNSVSSDSCKVVGITATSDRSDTKTLGTYFEDVAYEINLIDLIKQGYLAPIKARACQCSIDISKVSSVAGDYALGELGSTLEPYLDNIAEQIKQYASDRKTLIFLPLVDTAQKMSDSLARLGMKSGMIHGNSPDRKEILEKFKHGEIQYLCNSMLLTEGYDEPSIDCVVVLRPTKSRGLYSQMVGRGTRIHPGKNDLLILDFLWLTGKHNLIKPAHLISKDDEEAAIMQKSIEEQGELDIELAQKSAVEEREKKLKEELTKRRKPRPGMIDPLDYSLMVHDVDSESFEPTMEWHYLPVSDGQAKTLGGMGIDVGLVANRGHASCILNVIFDRRKMNMASPKQVRYLAKMGHKSPNLVSFDEAKEIITNDITMKKSWNR